MKSVILILTMMCLFGAYAIKTNSIFSKLNAPKLADEVFRDVQFSISISNDIVLINSPYELKCRIINYSTNAICYAPAALFVYMTNSLGNGCAIVESPKLQSSEANIWSPGTQAISFTPPLKTGQAKEWSVPFLISNNVPPGDYQIVADQIAVQPGTMLAKYLKSSLNIKIEK